MASIRRRGKGYQVQIRRLGHKPVSKTFLLRSDAERWARAAEIDADRGLLGNQICPKTRLAELLKRYLDTYVPHLKSQKQTTSLTRLMIGRLGHLLVAAIDSPTLATYRDKRLLLVSSQTVRKEIDIVRRVLRLANEEWGLLLPYGVPSIHMPRQPSGRERRVGDAELIRIYSHLTPVMQLAVQIAVSTGMRRGEVAKIKVDDLNEADSSLLVPETKTGKRRIVPLRQELCSTLRVHLSSHTGGLGVRPDSITQAFQRACVKADINDLCSEQGLSVPKVALISGHSDYRMLARYTHIR